MADRIIAALEYLDAHTSFVLQRSKHRSLGDIDSKYEIVDPNEMPLSAVIHDQINLLGVKRTNLSRQKTLDQILDEDRERIVQSAQRTRSAPSRKRIASSRPLTSNSGATKSKATSRGRRVVPLSESQATSSSASVTKMAFTRPGVNIGPSDARDEVMMEIANKPLTHTPPKARNSSYKTRPLTSTSLPGYGVISVGCRSLNSKKRSQTSHGRPSPRMTDEEEKWERKPGPFATVKVTGKDMWVVSDSTPPSYFNGDVNGLESSKLPGWEETANSVPREEKKSPPRFERQLGAPPQFGPTSQWYSFAGKEPSKKQPILTSFTEKRAGDYYNIESRVSETVLNQLQSRAGIRIGVNGNVVSESMKVGKKQQSNTATCDEGFSSDGEIEENPRTDCTSDAKTGDKGSWSGKEASMASDANDESMGSGVEEDEEENIPEKVKPIDTPQEEDRKFTLLRFVGVANGENPYVADSSTTSTSSGNLTALLADIARNVKNAKNKDADFATDDAVWQILRDSSPAFWISKEKWRKMREELQRKKSKRVAEIADGTAGLPLSWDEQLKLNDAKVLETKLRNDQNNNKVHCPMCMHETIHHLHVCIDKMRCFLQSKNDSLPVVFHKLLSYDQLPVGFVHLTNSGYRPHSTVTKVDKDLDLTAPSKGCESTITTPPRSAKSRNTNTMNGAPDDAFPARAFTSQSLTKRSRLTASETGSFDLSQLLTNQIVNEADPTVLTKPERKLDDVSREELEAMRQEAAKSMKMTGQVHSKLLPNGEEGGSKLQKPTSGSQQQRTRTVTLNSLPMKTCSPIATVDIRPSVPKASVPVSGLNLSDLDENYNVINGPNPPSPVSPVRMEEIFDLAQYVPLSSVGKFGPPNNTPKTPKVPPASSKMSSSDARSALLEDRLPSSNDGRGRTWNPRQGSKSASTLPRSTGSSPRNYPMQIAGDLPQHSPNRGFHGSPLTGRSQTGKPGQSRFGSTTKSYRTAAPNSPGAADNTGKGMVEMQTRTGFIQISHSLHIPPQRPSSAKAEKRNKVFDSYMRELTSRAEQNVKQRKGKPTGVIVKSLGGTSGKILPDQHHSVSKQQSSAANHTKSKTSYQSFSAHGGRKSGLSIANDFANPVVPQSKTTSNLHLGLHGDPVRLNLDKNIHNIYRDMGILKKSGNGSGPTSPLLRSNVMTYEEVQMVNNGSRRNGSKSGGTRRSDGTRSRAQSALSGDRVEDIASSHSVVTIPTAANSTHGYNDEDIDELEDGLSTAELENGMARDAKDVPQLNEVNHVQASGEVNNSEYHIRTTSAKKSKSNEVADSGTQWVSPELEATENEIKTEHRVGETHEVQANSVTTPQPTLEHLPVRMELDTGVVDADRTLEGRPSSEEVTPNFQTESEQVDSPPQENEVRDGEKNPDTTSLDQEDVTLQVEVAQENDIGSGNADVDRPAVDPEFEEETERTDIEPSGLAERRSYSDSHIDKIGKEDEDVEKDTEPESDVRGVTKVTVNIPPTAQ